MKNAPRTIILALSALAVSAFSVQAQLVSYNFNEGTGTTAANAGSLGSAQNLTLGSTSGWAAGVSGGASDFAYSNTTANNVNSNALSSNSFNSLNGGNKITIAGWFYLPSAGYSADGRIVSAVQGGNGFTLKQANDPAVQFGPAQNLQFITTSGFTPSVMQSTGNHYNVLNTWIFFAVTWDGSLTTNATSFYYGGISTSVASDSQVNKVGTSTLNAGTSVLGVANSSSPGQFNAFIGRLDEIKIYNSVLDQSQLESIRSAALVPEPGTLALAGLGLLGFGLSRRRRTRH